MFSEVILIDFINKAEDVQLPTEVITDSGTKTEFAQLEVWINIHFCNLLIKYTGRNISIMGTVTCNLPAVTYLLNLCCIAQNGSTFIDEQPFTARMTSHTSL